MKGGLALALVPDHTRETENALLVNGAGSTFDRLVYSGSTVAMVARVVSFPDYLDPGCTRHLWNRSFHGAKAMINDDDGLIDRSVVFVFGSNLAGRHGKGAALHALQHYGARYSVGVGPQGQAYAIPTKDGALKTLPLETIRRYVNEFLVYARLHPRVRFKLTAIGCGLAGYKPADIAPMFAEAPKNVIKPPEFIVGYSG